MPSLRDPPMLPAADREPLRVKGWTSYAAGAGLAFVVGVTTLGLDWHQAVGMVALQLLVAVPGLEWARGTFAHDSSASTWSPASVLEVAAGTRPPPDPAEIPLSERGAAVDIEPGDYLDANDPDPMYAVDTVTPPADPAPPGKADASLADSVDTDHHDHHDGHRH